MSFVRSRRTTTAAASRVLVTDAKPDAVTFYETLGFQALEGASEGLLVSEPMPMFLGIETIATALAP